MRKKYPYKTASNAFLVRETLPTIESSRLSGQPIATSFIGGGGDRGHVTHCFETAPSSDLRSVNMAVTVVNKCRGSLAFLTRTLSAPEFFTQCCYHKKVNRELNS